MPRTWILLALVFILSFNGIWGNEIYYSATSPSTLIGDEKFLPATTEYSIHFPLVRKDYNWAALQEWTPWAFQNSYVSQIYMDSEPGGIWVLADDNLYHSSNYGFRWEKIDTGYYRPHYFAIDNHSQTDSIKLIATYWGEVLSSVDLVNWTVEIEHPYAINTFFGWIDDTLYMAIHENSVAKIYRRTKDGVWEIVGDPFPNKIQELSIFQSALYAGTGNGLYKLEDSEWAPVFVYDTENPIIVNKIQVHNGKLIIGTVSPRGIYCSPDGDNWTALDVGLTNPYGVNIRQILTNGSGTLFAAADDGIFMSANDGERWQALDAGLRHTITGYGVLLENIHGTSLSSLRDDGIEQTLAASFNYKGLWLLTVNKDTWLKDTPPRVPPKAVLIVGPVDPPLHQATLANISWSNRLADIMQRNGMHVVKVYWPYSTWENVRAAIGGASIVVYKGHGTSVGEPSADPTEFHGGTNSFCLVNPTDPEGAILGTQDMLVTTNRLAENAIGFFYCCFCAGPSSTDPSPVPEDWARWRIEAYSSTMLRMGGRGYFSGVNEEAILESFFANLDKPIGEIFKSIHGNPEHISQHILSSDIGLWFDGNIQANWGEVFVGDPNLTPRQILGW
jgi:hypothetical protein